LPRLRLDSIPAAFTPVINPQIHLGGSIASPVSMSQTIINPQIHLGGSPSHTNDFLQPF